MRADRTRRVNTGARLTIYSLLFAVSIMGVFADTHYVNVDNSNALSPYTNWVDAATNIQDAVDVATLADVVLVADGTYVLSSQIVNTKGIVVQSVNGPTHTVVDALDMGAYEFVHSAADTDGDELRDEEEIDIYGTSPIRTDSDGDSMTDGGEVIAGTDPLDTNDCFAAREATWDQDNEYFTFSWNSATGRLYTVKTSSNLAASAWSDAGGYSNMPGTGSIMSYTTNNPSSGAGFYSVQVKMVL